MNLPSKQLKPDFSKVMKIVESQMEHWNKTGHFFDSGDCERQVFCEVLVAMYGKEIWEYINKRMRIA